MNSTTVTIPTNPMVSSADVGRKLEINGPPDHPRRWYWVVSGGALSRKVRSFMDTLALRHCVYPLVDFVEDHLKLSDEYEERLERYLVQLATFRLKVPRFLRPLCYAKNEKCGQFVITEVVDSTTLVIGD